MSEALCREKSDTVHSGYSLSNKLRTYYRACIGKCFVLQFLKENGIKLPTTVSGILDIYVLIKLWIYAFSDLLLRIDDWQRKRDEHTIVLRRELTTLFRFFHCFYLKTNSAECPPPSMPRRDAPRVHERTTRSGSTQRASSRDPASNRILAHPYSSKKQTQSKHNVYSNSLCQSNQAAVLQSRTAQAQEQVNHGIGAGEVGLVWIRVLEKHDSLCILL
jgi:hypothetical protein